MQRWILFAGVMSLASCAKETGSSLHGTASTEGWKALTINEAVSAGAQEVNEFGHEADWFELYNPGNALQLAAGEWFVSDDPQQPLKYELPAISIDEAGFVVIWCDGMDVVQDDVHTSFMLASEGERLSLARVLNGKVIIVDAIDIGAMEGDAVLSMGRYPDGTATWMPLAWPTAGGTNEAPAAELP